MSLFHFILSLLIVAVGCIAEYNANMLSTRLRETRRPSLESIRFLPPVGVPGHSSAEKAGLGGPGSEIMNLVLVASVDGRFHALNRSTGAVLWSMTPDRLPPALTPLVRTTHTLVELDDDPDAEVPQQEQYIIEPQSGDIYVLSDPAGPLQRLALNMAQLVEASPWTSSDTTDQRYFVGRKETSLIIIELETGKVMKTIASQGCAWEPEEDVVKSSLTEMDLDDLEDEDAPPQRTSTRLVIGRTDYHVAIHAPPVPGSSFHPPVQNLSFSVYGPNNQDLTLQSLYRRTSDDHYIQPLPDGQIVCVRAGGGDAGRDTSLPPQGPFVWRQDLPSPVVVAFDILHDPARATPYALLQPPSRLEEVFGFRDLSNAARGNQLPNLESAFVGLVKGSLFTMTPERFPLVIFDDARRAAAESRLLSIDSGRGSTRGRGGHDGGAPTTVDEETIRRKWSQMCRHRKNMDPRCLTGIKKMGASSRSRLARLLDQASTSSLLTGPTGSPSEHDGRQSVKLLDAPRSTAAINYSGIRSPISIGESGPGETHSVIAMGLLCFLLAAGSFWRLRSRLSFSSKASAKPVDVTTPSVTVGTEAMSVMEIPPNLILEKALTNVEDPAAPQSVEPISSISDQAVVTDNVSPPSLLRVPDLPADAKEALEESEKEDDDASPAPTLNRRKPVRRRRGKKKRAGAAEVLEDGSAAEGPDGSPVDGAPATAGSGNEADSGSNGFIVVKTPQPKVPAPAVSSLEVSEEILGFGSHGTVVFKGSLQGRAVAVKRLLQDFVTLASREVTILQHADDHPNVIRYYYQEAHSNFLYIALELCPASLADIVERPDLHRDIAVAFEPKRALRQITAGLRHLHALKIIHRDIKPPNILISSAKPGAGRDGGYRMLISDFGLCRKLEMDQTSFLPTVHGAMAAGTVGWRAPEILRGDINVDEPLGDDQSQSSRGSVSTVNGSTPGAKGTWLTKTVDIFALGCLFYYTLTNGGHPYGDRYERDRNILKDIKLLEGLEQFGEEGTEAVDLITTMLDPEASKRPDTTTCLLHPYFWNPGKRLNFLQDASDRFEIMCRDPRDLMLVKLETGAHGVVGSDWHTRLDKIFLDNLGKFRKYDGKSVQDLMRALRNKKHHYQDLPDNVKRHVGAMPDGFLAYFTRKFPRLFLHVYNVVGDSLLRHESMFQSYFEFQET